MAQPCVLELCVALAILVLEPQVKYFEGLTDDQKHRVADLMTVESFDPGLALIELGGAGYLGTISMTFFVVMTGRVSVQVSRVQMD